LGLPKQYYKGDILLLNLKKFNELFNYDSFAKGHEERISVVVFGTVENPATVVVLPTSHTLPPEEEDGRSCVFLTNNEVLFLL